MSILNSTQWQRLAGKRFVTFPKRAVYTIQQDHPEGAEVPSVELRVNDGVYTVDGKVVKSLADLEIKGNVVKVDRGMVLWSDVVFAVNQAMGKAWDFAARNLCVAQDEAFLRATGQVVD